MPETDTAIYGNHTNYKPVCISNMHDQSITEARIQSLSGPKEHYCA